MRCIKCNAEIETDDNFCHKCGECTVKGYMFLNDRKHIKMVNGSVIQQNDLMAISFVLMSFVLILFFVFSFFRGQDIFKPFIYLKKQIFNYKYGYNTSLIVNDNKYFNQDINSLSDAKEFIRKDISEQRWQCSYNNVEFVENSISLNYDIPSVSFCDVSLEEALKIQNVIKKIYDLFPTTKGYLTNITITNAKSKNDYVAYFQPIYQFVNPNNDINKYNKVNKTQILLNSYYFINENELKKNINDYQEVGWYVSDATWESVIAHEFGHYLSFVSLLKDNNIDSVIFVTKYNEEKISNILTTINNGSYTQNLLLTAVDNYNTKYKTNITVEQFALNISKYAGSKNTSGNLIYDEVIAEAVHDYYLHDTNAKKESLEIIDILNNKLAD